MDKFIVVLAGLMIVVFIIWFFFMGEKDSTHEHEH